MSRAREWEAGREMNVARGKAAQSRAPGSKRKRLALGKSAAKDMIAATRKKTRAKRGD